MAKGMLTIINPDGQIISKAIDYTPKLDELQAAVGGHIEVVPYFDKYNGQPCVVFCNEEGKLHGLPVNPVAKAAWEKAYGRRITEDFLVGRICIVCGDQALMDEL